MGQLLGRGTTVSALRYIVGRMLFMGCCSVGDSAKNAFHSNPENTVFDAKRLIGRKYDEPEVQRDMKHW